MQRPPRLIRLLRSRFLPYYLFTAFTVLLPAVIGIILILYPPSVPLPPWLQYLAWLAGVCVLFRIGLGLYRWWVNSHGSGFHLDQDDQDQLDDDWR